LARFHVELILGLSLSVHGGPIPSDRAVLFCVKMNRIMNFAEKLRKKRTENASVATLAGEKVFLVFPPIQVVPLVKEKAESIAASELASIAEDLKAKPADEREYAMAVESIPEDQRPPMPESRYAQKIESQANQEMIILVAPYMMQDETGNPVASNERDREIVREEVAKDLEFIKALSEKFKEFGQTFAGQVSPEKKKS
jgi:hypothetical protein